MIAFSSPHLPELLAPAGNWECAKAAVENGADAIYFGLDRFNARMRADNFTLADLPELMAFLHDRGVKGYLTLNTLIFTGELAAAEDYLRQVIAAGVDAAIVQDWGLVQLIRHLSSDFPIHGSTQMTVTSAAGVTFAQGAGCDLVVLARECAIKEMHQIQKDLHDAQIALPLEVFVHGALCVAYSGQCLTSEALGGRSANRGECAQACRMPYEMIVDGEEYDLGDRRYLLSPQDLSGLAVLPELVEAGILSLKIEGRLKQPEYVAAVTRTYRQALDRLGENLPHQVQEEDRYTLEMAFSRGLFTGWLEGIDNQRLVHGRYGKKRGVYLGFVAAIRGDRVKVRLQAPLKAGDGVVFDSGDPQQKEEGGRVYAVIPEGGDHWIAFGRRDLDLRRLRRGDRLWKTSDPELDRHLRQSYQGEQIRHHRPLHFTVQGQAGEPLTLIAEDGQGHRVALTSEMPLEIAQKQPLTSDRLAEQLGRLGNTSFSLGELHNQLTGTVMLPMRELNRLRREAVEQLQRQRRTPQGWHLREKVSFGNLLPPPEPSQDRSPQLIPLVRKLEQLAAIVPLNFAQIYCELEDPSAYKKALAIVQACAPQTELWIAPPRITKPREKYILQQLKNSGATGYLIRNYDHLEYFAGERQIADFSLNIANPITAQYFKTHYPLEWLTASYDLNVQQLGDLLHRSPPHWWEITIHQYMPMFHMEHCVFCAFLSEGTDFTNCGRPCDKHEVKLRDRTGVEHILSADAGCRNTLFNGTAQTGAEAIEQLQTWGISRFRVEFLQESPQRTLEILRAYQKLLQGQITGGKLWRDLNLHNQLGVTRGTLIQK